MLCRYVPGGVERAEKVCWVFGICVWADFVLDFRDVCEAS